MIEVKWMSLYETKLLKGVPNIDTLDVNFYEIYRKYIVADILKKGVIFSGEAHTYGKSNTPTVWEGRKCVGKMVLLPDCWSRLMVEIWQGHYDKELKIHELRSECTWPKWLEKRYP